MNSVPLMLSEFIVVLGMLWLADRWLHRNLQIVTFLLANDREVALWLYAILLLPGVILHEVSHAFAAAILGVNIGGIHVLPRRVGKDIILGYVPVEQTDFVRASMIGAAPFFCGGAVIVIIGYLVFGTADVVASLAAGDWMAALNGLAVVFKAPDAWIWAYLIFAIGNTMLPSKSDTHAWPTLGIVVGLLVMVLLVINGGPEFLNEAGQLLAMPLRWIVLLGGSTLLVDLPFFAIIFVALRFLEFVRGVRLEYH
ncbi:MAG: hypothetical protein JXA21_15585 [Anaerolineae bacterium]|nr:hypothetical protein [Anaerolineae bacterium]